MFFTNRAPGRPDDTQRNWALLLFNYLSTDALLNFLERPMTKLLYLEKLCELGVFPPKGHFLSALQLRIMRCHDFAVQILDLSRVEVLSEPSVLDLLQQYNDITQLIIPGNYICHSSVVLALSRMKLKKVTIARECQVSDAFELLLSCKRLSCMVLPSPAFIEGTDGQVDAVYYSRPLVNLRALSVQISDPGTLLTTLSLPFFENLEYLHIQLMNDAFFTLQHAALRSLKISSAGERQIRCCDVSAPLLERFDIFGTVYMSGAQMGALLSGSAALKSANVCMRGRVRCALRSASLLRLQIRAIQASYPGGLDASRPGGDIFDASALQYIAEGCGSLVELAVTGIQSAVVDKHIYGILVNLRSLLALHLQCCRNYSHVLVFHPVSDNFFKSECGAVDTFQQALVAQNKLQELHLENLEVSDGFAYALFILEHNYALKRIELINLRRITDASVFLLLTSTEIRQDADPGHRAPYSLPQSHGSSVTLSSACMSATTHTKSYRSNFSIQFFDGVLEEQCMYQIEEITIIQCPHVSRQVTQAFLLAGFRLWSVATDVYLSVQFVTQLRSQRPWIRVEARGEDAPLKNQYLSTRYKAMPFLSQ